MPEQVGPASSACVPRRHQAGRQRPFDSEIRIVVRNGDVFGGIVGAINPVADVGGGGQRLEAM